MKICIKTFPLPRNSDRKEAAAAATKNPSTLLGFCPDEDNDDNDDGEDNDDNDDDDDNDDNDDGEDNDDNDDDEDNDDKGRPIKIAQIAKCRV